MNYKEFEGVEELWFWFCGVMITEQAGQRPKIGGCDEPRICDKNAIYKLLKQLKDKGRLTNKHLRVMSYWGQIFISPLNSKRSKYSDRLIWIDGLQILEKEAILKGYLNAV